MSTHNSPSYLPVLMSHLTLIGAALLPCIAVSIWVFWDLMAPMVSGNLRYAFDLTSLGAGARLAGFGISLTGALIQGYGLLSLRKTFQEAVAGRPLSAKAVHGFRRFAWVTLAMVFVGVLQQTALIVVFSLSDPNTQGQLSINFGSDEVKAFFMALLLVFVAHVFATGKKAVDENESFL